MRYFVTVVMLGRLPEEVQAEICKDSLTHQFFGPGQTEVDVITFQGALKLIMAVPGENARALRTQFAELLQRFFAGDPTLVSDLAQNLANDDEAHRFAREDAGVPEMDSNAFQDMMLRFITTPAFANRVMEISGPDALMALIPNNPMFVNQMSNMIHTHAEVMRMQFETQRKRQLYDNRMIEARKVTEHKRKLEQISKDTEAKIAFEKAVVEVEEAKKKAAIELEEAKKKAAIELEEAKRKTFSFEVECQREMLELKKVMKEMDAPTPPAPPAPPAETNPPLSVPPPGYNCIVTVSRVANFVLRLSDYTTQVRDKALNRAGREAAKLSKPYGGKRLGLFGQSENSYPDKDYAMVKKCVEDAFDYERRMSNDITNYLRNGN